MTATRHSKSNARNGSTVSGIKIDGLILKGSAAFDTFWRLAAERHEIYEKRCNGAERPWTSDKILAKYKFCNTFRVCDKVSQFIITDVIEKGSADPREVIFRVVLFDIFTKIDTWVFLLNRIGPLCAATYNRRVYADALEEAREELGTLYTGAFQKPSCNRFGPRAHLNHLTLLEVLMEELPPKISNAKYMADIYEYLVGLPGMGEFNSYQLLVNLSYSSVMNFSDNDFVVPGCGAISGLKRCFGEKGPKYGEQIIREMVRTQDQHFDRLDLVFLGLGTEHRPMTVVDVEHTLCELDKYCRGNGCKSSGTQHRTSIGRTYQNEDKPPPLALRLPKAWSHPDRKKSRIRRTPIQPRERYVIRRILGHRENRAGKITEFHIDWLGYTATDRSWESSKNIEEDAPEAVRRYLEDDQGP